MANLTAHFSNEDRGGRFSAFDLTDGYPCCIIRRLVLQAIGSGVERFLDTEEVTGSNPVSPIYFDLHPLYNNSPSIIADNFRHFPTVKDHQQMDFCQTNFESCFLQLIQKRAIEV